MRSVSFAARFEQVQEVYSTFDGEKSLLYFYLKNAVLTYLIILEDR